MAYCGPRGIPHSLFASWERADRDKALWWHIRQAQTCPSCGTHPDDWADDPWAFEAAPTHCRGCEVKGQADEDFEKHRKEYRRGTSIQLRRPPPAEEA